jgi:hypothetical protein
VRRVLTTAAAVAALLACVPSAQARAPSVKKGIWGPIEVGGVSQFPIYRTLGVGLFHERLRWVNVAPTRPAKPRNPRDPAYRWPAELDQAVRECRRYGIKLAVEVAGTPRWANGGRPHNWAPTRPRDYARFLTAAVRRYPSVRYWVIWGEPVRRSNFMPLPKTRAWKPLTRAQAKAPRRYARLLDAAYGAIKRVNRRALVVGGNSFTNGDIAPRNWIANLRLPSGRPPRMDLYGHNPFSARKPDLSKGLIRQGMADFSDLDALAGWVDRDLGRTPQGRRIKLFLGEYAIPTDHVNYVFGWYVSQATQASWLAAALRIARRWSRIETLVYFSLYDEAPRPGGDEMNRGLLDVHGNRKPAFAAYERG